MGENKENSMAFQSLIKTLGLEEFYPEKINLNDVMKIKQESINYDMRNVPWDFLRNIIMLNFNARDKMIKKYVEKILVEEENMQTEDFFDSLLQGDKPCSINPIDLTVAVFKCCSPVLQQIFCSKLFMCKLAVPFVFHKENNELPLMSLWSLRSLIFEGRTSEDQRQKMAVNFPLHIISFIRIGRPQLSKSNLMNAILTDEHHDTFFNKDSSLGTTTRNIGNGLIEAAWYLPSEKSTIYENVTMFLNLRGDGNRHNLQLQLISKLTTIVVVITDLNQLTERSTQELLTEFHKSTEGVLLAIDASNNDRLITKTTLKKYKDNNTEYDQKTKFSILAIEGELRSLSVVKDEIRKGINNLVKGIDTRTLSRRLEQISDFCKIDEHCELNKETREKAKQIIRFIPKEGSNVKRQLVPLQGETWRSWSEHSKVVKKSSMYKSYEEENEIEIKMKATRMQQLEVCKQLGPVVDTFLRTILKDLTSETQTHLFVGWLKLYLDERSRSILPAFLQQYHSDWQKVKLARDKKELYYIENYKKNLEQSETNLAEASFGFEHLMREAGQIYEALIESKTKLSKDLMNLATCLPCLSSKLLQMGYPFEIMDGDTANVPITWVKAVLSSLKSEIGDKKILTLSVLGIQSSGKSTLLNTMFGLQFAVSAGRCTRGVFIQLLPVQPGEFPFDYVLVIDTEGLRAPELGDQKYNHDNELATFVIGLGDITMINIKGENTAEMKDVLQIAIHAFLRLKLVNKKINLKQSCIFVHQNVPTQGASDKMMQGRNKFVEILDKMTKEAADQENLADIQSFNQVIEFDSEKNVFYFSDLWEGDPPMAPANPGYSNNVCEVKNAIFELTRSRDTYLPISLTIPRICDLWSGIQADDFVFSFRNSLELKAYNSIDRKCQALNWELETFVSKFVLTKGKSECSIEEINQKLHLEVSAQVKSLGEEIDNFVKSHPLKEILCQWTENKKKRLTEFSEDLKGRVKKNLIRTKEEMKIKRIRNKDKQKHEEEINKLARKLANEEKGKKPSETVLKQRFDSIWSTWINSFFLEDEEDIIPIEKQIKSLVVEKFQKDAAFMQSFNSKSSSKTYEQFQKLEDTISVYDISEKDHISIMKSFFRRSKEEPNVCRSQAIGITNQLFRKIDGRLSEINSEDIRFDQSNVSHILHMITEGIEDHNEHKNNDYKFNFSSMYKAMIVTHTTRFLIEFFTERNDKYNEKHSPKAQLEEYKGTAWTLLKNLVNSKTEDAIVAGFFKDEVIKIVSESVSDHLPIDVSGIILDKFSHQKYSLMKAIMVDLAQADNFDWFKGYISDPTTYAKKYLTKILNKEIFGNVTNGSSQYANLAKRHMDNFFSMIKTSITEATNKCEGKTLIKVSEWRELFVDNATSNNFPISNDILIHVQCNELSDVQNFKQILTEQLEEMQSELLMTFKNTDKDSVQWKENPLSKIMSNLWGCEEKCMYCREPCVNTDKDHIKLELSHKCIQHRPLGIGGHHYSKDDTLVIEFCNFNVQSDTYYVTKRGTPSEERRKYKDYKRYHPDWDIQPTPDASKYWMWVLSKYRKELSKMYDVEIPKIPNPWLDISKDDAIESLK